jgi:hypothetical protein
MKCLAQMTLLLLSLAKAPQLEGSGACVHPHVLVFLSEGHSRLPCTSPRAQSTQPRRGWAEAKGSMETRWVNPGPEKGTFSISNFC